LVRSLWSRVEEAAVGIVMLILALCQQGKVPQQAGEVAGQAGKLAERILATSLVATPFVAQASVEKTDFDFDSGDTSPPPTEIRKGKVGPQTNVKPSRFFGRPNHQSRPTLRIARRIDREWRRLVGARKSVHNAFARLINKDHPPQSKQKPRKQQRS